MNSRILFVDDEPAVLEGYRRTLYKDFQLKTAASGEAALADIQGNGNYAVVVSDMQMPGMNGLQLLSRVREISPQTVRVVLTGHADIETALAAVNEDAVFRFLTKPCDPGLLKRTITSCLMQHRLVRAESELLENTLMSSINVLTDLLSLVSPAAFARSLRINRYVQHMVRTLGLEASWRYEAAAMLSQLGCITLPTEVVEAACSGKGLTSDQRVSFESHPAISQELLANIPRLEGIAWIVGQQSATASIPQNASETMKTGVAILRIAIAFDELKMQGHDDRKAVVGLLARPEFDERIVHTLETLPAVVAARADAVEIGNLKLGMVLSEEIRTIAGELLAVKGQIVIYPLIVRLKNALQRQTVKDRVSVLPAKAADGEKFFAAQAQ